MKKGFALIELMISFLIAGFIAAALLTLIAQMVKVQEVVTSLTTTYGRIAIVQNQLERDIMGAFVPAQVDMIPTSTERKEQPKQLDKIFYGTSQEGGRFELLTCIISSPLEIFFGVKNAKLKPHVARVVYRLIPDPMRKNSFILTRQEGISKLDFEAYGQNATGEFRSFDLIDGIQNFIVSYVTIEQTPAKEGESAKRTYKDPKKWDSAAKKDETTQVDDQKKQDLKKDPVRLPNQLRFELSLWDATYSSIKTFIFTIPVAYKASEYEVPSAVKEASASGEQKSAGKQDQKEQVTGIGA